MEDPEERMHSAVGVLTSEEREVWARWRKELEADEDNAESLRIIDTALFVLCLDDTTPPRCPRSRACPRALQEQETGARHDTARRERGAGTSSWGQGEASR